MVLEARTFKSVEDFYQPADLAEGEIDVAGKSMKVSAIGANEIRLLMAEFDTKFRYANPALKELCARAFPHLVDALRAVKYKTRQKYKGYKARGQELDFTLVRPGMLYYNTGPRIAPDSWLRTYNTIGWNNLLGDINDPINVGTTLIEGITSGAQQEDEAFVLPGFINKIDVPKVNEFRVVKNGDPYHREQLEFEYVNGFDDVGLVELKQTLIFAPREAFTIRVRNRIVGDDRTAPVMFRVTTADKLGMAE